LFLFSCGILAAAIAFGGDVTYTLWDDEEDQIWIRIQNGSDQNIKIEFILLAFYDSKGRPVSQKQYGCTESCVLNKHGVADFGPYLRPEGSTDCRLQRVRYVTQ